MSQISVEKYRIPAQDALKIRCRCDHEWIYKGIRKLFVLCPACHTTLNLTKITINKMEGQKT
jgi:hypothetical protein